MRCVGDASNRADAAVPIEQAHGSLAERRCDDLPESEGDVVRADRNSRLAKSLAVETVAMHHTVVAAGDEDLLPRERDVLRRGSGLDHSRGPAPGAVEGDASLGARRDPDRPAVGREHDVVSEEGRHDRSFETRSAGVGVVQNRDPSRGRSERCPERPAVDADADVTGRARNASASEDPTPDGVDRHDFLRRGVRDVHEVGAREDRGVARRLESLELGPDAPPTCVDKGYESVLRVCDDGGTTVDSFDAAWTGGSRDPGDYLPGGKPDQNDMALLVGRYERDSGTSEARSEGTRLDRQSQRGRARSREECLSIHVSLTLEPSGKVPDLSARVARISGMDLADRSRRSLGKGCVRIGTSAPACEARSEDRSRISRRCSGCTGRERFALPTSSRTTPAPPRTSRRSRFSRRSAALDRFDRSRPFGPWLHRIVVNRAIDWTRARKLRSEVELVDTFPAPEAAEHDDDTFAALSRLAPEHRAVIVLRYLLEFTPGEIAEALDLPRGTVNSRLRRGLDALGDEL